MKLNEQTIAVLSNFQTINQSIAIEPGNLLRTISSSETVVAMATISDNFDKPFAIYDLSRFLAILSLSKDDHDIVFGDQFMTIRQGSSKIKYYYCDPFLIKTAPKKINSPKSYVRFELSQHVLINTIKAMQILKFSEIAITGDGSKLEISAVNSKDDESTTYSTEIGDTDKNFTCIIEVEKLKLLSGDYTVSLMKEGMAHFKSNIIEYWIAINSKSQFD